MDTSKHDAAQVPDPTTPTFSVVIPTYDRNEQLVVCLNALAAQEYPHTRFEVIVVDDGSPAPPREALQQVESSLDIKLHTQPNAGPGTARNTGANCAEGTYLAFVDDDCIPAQKWLAMMAESLTQQPGCAVGGRTINGLPTNLCAVASQKLVDYLYHYYNQDPEHAWFFATNNLAVPADQFRALGGFGSRFSYAAEDRDFCARWLKAGWNLRYQSHAIVYHKRRMALAEYWQQHIRCGRGAFRYHLVHTDPTHRSLTMDRMRFSIGLMGYPLVQGSVRHRLSTAILFALAQIATAAGYVQEAHRGNAPDTK